MKICHICLSSFYVDGRLYQENELVIQHMKDGHEVIVIASTESHSDEGELIYVTPRKYIGAEGAKVIRLPYRKGIPKILAQKLRIHPDVYMHLEQIAPDVILFHGSAGWELINVAKYVKNNANCIFYIDSHSDEVNSATNWFSRNLLHRQFYSRILHHALGRAGALLCVSTSVMEFAEKIYKIPKNRLEFYPLGGHPPDDYNYSRLRSIGRARLGITGNQILIIQSGKQSRSKKLIESLRAFSAVDHPGLILAIAGTIHQEIKNQAEALISADPRIIFLGWQNSQTLTELLCAADVYLQPGTQSATMQQSLCCRCAVILADCSAHDVYKKSNGWFISDNKSLQVALSEISDADIKKMADNSYKFALEKLNYANIGSRVFVKS